MFCKHPCILKDYLHPTYCAAISKYPVSTAISAVAQIAGTGGMQFAYYSTCVYGKPKPGISWEYICLKFQDSGYGYEREDRMGTLLYLQNIDG